MIVIASRNGRVGIEAAWAILAAGGSALDAVEAGTRHVEDNPDDHSVGYSGYPNLLGEVELDASIMEGTRLRAGAVGALRGYRQAISIARRVMEELPHVLLAGEGAAQFAAQMGFARENLLTEAAAQTWREGIERRMPGATQLAPADLRERLLRQGSTLVTDPEHVAGTVNFIAQDSAGQIASAVSTSGWAWKYPGRLGDSPIIGAGNYADDRYGAAACTGWGELALRTGVARSVVLYLKHGYALEAACREALSDLLELVDDPAHMVMSVIALDHQGNHCAVSTSAGRSYICRTAAMEQFAVLPRVQVGQLAGDAGGEPGA